MLLQLIVIHYDEDESYIKNFLDVLKLQQWINFNDFEVLIENDGDKVVYDKSLFKGYPFKIQYHINEWSGRSGVRQHGLNRAVADYVMFCDCDDTFLGVDSLYKIFNTLVREKPDVLFSTFITNFVENGKTVKFRDYYNENVWIHGKCFRTKFLKDNDISWNVKLNNFEDVYFVRLVDSFRPKKYGIKDELYAWKYRATSATRSSTRDGGFMEMLDYKNAIFSQNEAIETFKKLGKDTEAGIKLFVTMLETYYTVSATEQGLFFDRDYTKYPEEVKKMFAKMYLTNKKYLEKIDGKVKSVLYNVILNRFFVEKNTYWQPKQTLEDFIADMIKKYGGED